MYPSISRHKMHFRAALIVCQLHSFVSGQFLTSIWPALAWTVLGQCFPPEEPSCLQPASDGCTSTTKKQPNHPNSPKRLTVFSENEVSRYLLLQLCHNQYAALISISNSSRNIYTTKALLPVLWVSLVILRGSCPTQPLC